ncbi:MAG: ATP-binding protein [Prevotella sp.]|nr:ATP-binding protein [Prevotella sp.]
MLVEFSFQNCFSFCNEANFSMVAANTVKEMEGDSQYSNVTALEDTSLRILRIGAIYGANASGKTNVLRAISFFRDMIIGSFVNETLLENSDSLHFLFVIEQQEQPLSFEMIFIVNDTRFRYGFEIKDKKIHTEWLFMRLLDNARESYCFTRENNAIKINAKVFKGANKLIVNTRDNALFLSTTAQFNVEISKIIKDWFATKLQVIVAPNVNTHFTANKFMKNEWMRQHILDFIKLIDLGIEDMSVKERNIDNISKQMSPKSNDIKIGTQNNSVKAIDISTVHSVYKGNEVIQQLSLPFEMESFGTTKIFSLLGPWFDCLKNGGTLIVDEFGASIHTQLAIQLIRLFQSSLNTHGAQLIISTHNTNLLRKDLLRRDQIWFVEKDKQGVSDLYSLVEYKINQAQSVRNDASYQKDYLIGKYGAIPYFGNIEKFITDYSDGIQE